ncbi:MAG: 50S ribosomal protein L7/L12 [Firmicutes bacterium]|nr:50S ribosomal protein L7/L12 [Bacillota bacterium]
MAKIAKEELIDAICSLSLLEAAEIVKELEEKLGVSAAAPVAMVAAAPGAAAEAAEERTTFNVELSEVGSDKIQVIKVLREVTSLGLKEAKDLVEAAPKMIKEGVSKEEAESIKKKFEEKGAKVSVK